MKYLAWAVLSLGLLSAVPAKLAAQNASSGDVELGRNYPNPFNPETTIPFQLRAGLFEGGHKPVVSLRIYNILAQLVAVPILQGSGEELDDLALDWNGTGQYRAYWDGKVLGTGQEAASGVYVYQLIVDGRRVLSRRMTVIR
ncbi:MAG: hypothetical protein ACE5FJ_12020 [Gemmatimonadales bacterium]